MKVPEWASPILGYSSDKKKIKLNKERSQRHFFQEKEKKKTFQSNFTIQAVHPGDRISPGYAVIHAAQNSSQDRDNSGLKSKYNAHPGFRHHGYPHAASSRRMAGREPHTPWGCAGRLHGCGESRTLDREDRALCQPANQQIVELPSKQHSCQSDASRAARRTSRTRRSGWEISEQVARPLRRGPADPARRARHPPCRRRPSLSQRYNKPWPALPRVAAIAVADRLLASFTRDNSIQVCQHDGRSSVAPPAPLDVRPGPSSPPSRSPS